MGLPQLHVILPERFQRFVPAARRGLAFGIPELDALLPLGLPRGQITALDAPLGSGGTALLLALAEATLRADEGVAFVDAARTLAPQAAAHLGDLGPFWVIRPRGTESAWWCTDVLLRTGAFGLVIVDQAPTPARTVAVRLQRLARDKDVVLVVRAQGHRGTGAQTHGHTAMTAAGREERGDAGRRPAPCVPSDGRSPPFPRDDAPARTGTLPDPREQRSAASATHNLSVFGAALALSVRPAEGGFIPATPGSGAAWPAPRPVRVLIEKGGAPRAAEVSVGAPLPHRLRPHWAVRDRRAGRPGGGISGRTQRQRAAQPDWPIR
jgi:hypothetical protein